MSRDKVLFIGHYREASAWGTAGQGYIHALKAAGFDVAARPIKLSNVQAEVDETILKAEDTSAYGARYCIQHLLPHHMEYSGEFEKCIGMAAIDSFNLTYTGWLDRLALMDEAWTFNSEHADDLRKYLSNTVRSIPHAFDMSVYQKEYEPVDFPLPEGTVKFYTIADLNRRKNLAAIVRAFRLAFPTDYPVALVIKVGKPGTDPQSVFDEVNDMTVKMKQHLRIYKNIEDYHNEIVISDNVSKEGIYKLHKSCDCYVSASYSEGFCIPAFDAMAFGNTVIASNTGGPKDYLEGYLVDGRREPVFGMAGTFDNLFTSHEDWYSVDIRSLVDAMKKAFFAERPNKVGVENAKSYSYEAVGETIRQYLREGS